MCKADNNFSKNLKTLRKNYGETQLDLACSIGLEGEASISYYENDKRYPNPDTLKKIADHYRVSEDGLVNGIVKENDSFEKKISIKDMNSVALKVLPLISTEEAIKNLHFKKALEYHKKHIDAISRGLEDFDYSEIFEKSFDKYVDADIPEAYANILWWTTFWQIIGCNIQAAEYMDRFEHRKNYSMQEMLKVAFLKDFSEDIVEESVDYEFLEDLNEVAEEAINKLKQYHEWADLIYFYTAIRYLYCYINNGRSENQNREIGAEMLLAFYDLDNKYAISFINLLHDLLN